MAGDGRRTFEVGCPHCGARLTLDAKLGRVVAHRSPPKQAKISDLDHSRRLLKEEAARREAHFRQSAEEEKTKSRLLERKFEEAMKRAQGEPSGPPTRDIDLE